MTGGCEPHILHVDVDTLVTLCDEATLNQFDRTLSADLAREALDPHSVVHLEPVKIIHLHLVNEDGMTLDSDWLIRCRATGTFHGDEIDDVGLIDIHADTYTELKDREGAR